MYMLAEQLGESHNHVTSIKLGFGNTDIKVSSKSIDFLDLFFKRLVFIIVKNMVL